MCGIYVSAVTPLPAVGDINESTMGISLSVLVGIGVYELIQYRREKEKEKSRRSTQAVFEVGKEDQSPNEGKNRSGFSRLRQPFRSRRKSPPSSGVRPAQEQQDMDDREFDIPPPYTPTVDENTHADSAQLAWAKL